MYIPTRFPRFTGRGGATPVRVLPKIIAKCSLGILISATTAVEPQLGTTGTTGNHSGILIGGQQVNHWIDDVGNPLAIAPAIDCQRVWARECTGYF